MKSNKPSTNHQPPIPYIAKVQAAYYLTTAIWPFISQPSFELVTGPKTDKWLVKTVAALIAIIGLALLVPGSNRQRKFIGVNSAAVLSLIDICYACRGIISKVYLADAALEIVLLSGWALLPKYARKSHFDKEIF